MATLSKERGNDSFKNGQYEQAVSHYSDAISMDPSNPLYYLNRSMANLKLERWSQAEEDATTSLKFDGKNVKAFYRRSLARMELGKSSEARDDIESFIRMGGTIKGAATDLLAKLAKAKPSATASAAAEPVKNDSTQAGQLYKIADAGAKGLGAFALKQFSRGDLILSESPLFKIKKLEPSTIKTKVGNLSVKEQEQYFSLTNAFSGSKSNGTAVDIFQSNSMSLDDEYTGIFAEACRFNHSCLPNARYSWNSNVGRQMIYALRSIAVGEELFVSYLASRGVYGSTRSARQARLARYGFTCACIACQLPGPESTKSDQRRTEVAKIWETIPYYSPSQSKKRLTEIARAIHILQEEGYMADYDDFTNDAAAICAFHSDWASAEYWARLTYETRVAEFGRDSPRAKEVKGHFLNPRTHSMAGMGSRQTFNVRL